MSLRPQGKSALQPERLTSQRTAFSPALVRYANLAPQTTSAWSSAAGTATVTTGIAAPDSTTDAATLSTVAPPENYRRIYNAECTLAIGDRVIAGVWVKASALSQGASQASGTMDGFAAATLRIEDDTAGYTFDLDGLNYRNLTATSAADSRWEWVSTNIKIESAPSGNTANLVLDLNCDSEHSISFYAPVLWHIPAAEMTDDDIDELMLGLYSVPDQAEAGIIATLRGQSFQSKIRDAGGEKYNVKSSGAAGDGVTDDGAAVNNAAVAAFLLGKPLYFPAGTYLGVNLTSITNYAHIYGDGPQQTILKASAVNTPVIEISNASSRMIRIENLTVEGAGASSGSSGHGIYLHGNSGGTDNVFLRNVFVINCGGDGVKVDSHFTNKFEGVFISNCGGSGFDISGGNTILFDTCYVDDVVNGGTGYRVRAGQAVFLNCNGIDSLGSVSDWAVLGQQSSDGDATDTYVDALLIGCNVESFKRYGVKCKSGSRADFKACFFTTSSSGSAHVAIYHNFTNNQVGSIDATCRFNVQGSGTWADGYEVHSGNDIPLLSLGRVSPASYYNDSLAAARSFPVLSTTAVSTNPYVYVNALSVGGSAVQGASVAGFLGWTATNSNSSGQAGFYGVNHSGKNVFLQVFQDGTGIAQLGSDHFPLYVKAEGNNRWYFANGEFSPLQNNTSDLGAAGTRIKDGFIAGSLNFSERSTPSTPAANSLVIYAKDNGGASTLYWMSDSGTEYDLSATGGGSGDVVGPGSATDNALTRFDSTTGKIIQDSGVTLSDLATNTYTLAANPPTVAGTSTAGYHFVSRASDAVAGNVTNGAAAGGDYYAIAGDAKRLTSGNANGGNLYLTPGAGIGTGTDGQVILGRVGTGAVPALTWAGNTNSGISIFNSGIQFSLSGINAAAVTSNGYKVSNAGRLDFSSDSTTSGTTDTALSRFAANTLRVGGDTAGSTAGKVFISRSDKTHVGWFTVDGDTANTSTVADVGAIGLDSTGTAAAGLGAQLQFTLESSTTNQQQAAGMTWVWTTATHASRTADLFFSTVNSGTVGESFRIVAGGAWRTPAIADPSAPTNGDTWRSSTRNAISTRVSGQTEDLSATMWRSSAQSSFDTTSAATSVIADTGVGTKTIAANRLAVGNQIRITAGGLFGTKASSAGTLTMRVRTGGTTMVTATFTLPDGLVDQAWSLEAVGALNTAGSSGVTYWRLAWLITDSSGVVYMPNVTTNSTAINTTTSRALDVTAQFSASDADNYFQTDNATIEILA